MSVSTLGIHFGVIQEVELVREASEDWKKQIIRMFSSKTALAARIDLQMTHQDGSIGASLLEEIQNRFEKISGPQKAQMKLPIPVPEEKKRRG